MRASNVVGAAAALAAVVAAAAAAAAAPPPNILVILADDQGYGDVGFNAVPSRQHIPGAAGAWAPNPPRTPNLDAWAADASSIVFTRAYSGSPVCSPTRSSLLTGRTPDRECVFNAEGCGQQPAWECIDPMPFPNSVPTLARTLNASGFATMHLGKACTADLTPATALRRQLTLTPRRQLQWHLGDFFPKDNKNPSYAYKKWPVMNPGMVGFGHWFSTEASASSTTLNCGCDAAWPLEAPGCVLGGGAWTMGKSLACTNFWSPTDSPHAPVAACHEPATATLACVANSTVKVQGDSTLHMLERLAAFVNASTAAAQPFFAALELHTNHLPHPSLPQYFHLYNDTNGLPAGDYLGTLTQMDAGVGAVRQMLRDAGVEENTLVFYFADNGPHPGKFGDGAGGIKDVQTATNGLRQCKASVFEGGIRVPGFVSWPGVITQNGAVDVPVFVPDIFPTVLELMGATYPEPSWPVDGESILGLLRAGAGGGWQRSKPLAWRLEGQAALLDSAGRYKLVRNPEAGQCDLQPSSYSKNLTRAFLFDLLADATESNPLNDAQPALLAAMEAEMAAWEASILVSEQAESQCLPPAPSNASFLLAHAPGGLCLGAASAVEHGALSLDAANCAAGFDTAAALTRWRVSGSLALAAAPTFGLHSLAGACALGTEVVLGEKDAPHHMLFDAATGTVQQPGCAGRCLGAGAALVDCASADATAWSTLAASGVGGAWRARGIYREPLD